MQKIKITIEKTNTGFSAGVDKYPVYSAGDNLKEIKQNILEAINLYFDYMKQPLVAETDLQFTLDIQSFFNFYKVINAKALSDRIGMNQSLLAQYISGIKKPSPSQTKRILEGIREVGKELSDMRFLL